MKLGNIIHATDLVNHEKVEYINYIQDNILSFSELNFELPTLYVGWKYLKETNKEDLIIQNQSILEKKIVKNLLYWEYSFNENKAQHISGIKSFVKDVPFLYFSSKYNYINIDPVFFQLYDINDLLDVLPKEIDSYYNYKGEMLYILKDNNIWGIDLNIYEYFNFDIESVLIKITNKSTSFTTDLDGSIYQEYYKKFPDFDYLKRYIIVFLSK